jgi:multimeric flavodoxin WrbA
MKVIGISCSRRKWGNTEILVRQALAGAAGLGAEVSFLRLPELDIRQCTGCMSCIIKQRDCVLGDDFSELLATWRQAQAVVLGTPVYSLFAAGSLQNLKARLFYQDYSGDLAGKTGVALALGGKPGWEGWALAQTSLLLRSLGIMLVDQFMGYGQGPGEVLFSSEVCARAERAGRALAQGVGEYVGRPGVCPCCHLDMVETRPDGKAHCPVCDLSGTMSPEPGMYRFLPDPNQSPRWSREAMVNHFDNMIVTSRDNYLANKNKIAEKLSVFKQQYKRQAKTTDID